LHKSHLRKVVWFAVRLTKVEIDIASSTVYLVLAITLV
jgi:hypothetical protein